MKRYLLASIAALLSAVIGAPAFAQTDAPASIPGTTVSITPPPGYGVATDFSGLSNPETGGSFLVNELPIEAAAQLGALFSSLETAAPSFATRNVTLEREVALETPDSAAPKPRIYAGTQIVAGATYKKWVGLYVADMVVLLTYQAPKDVSLTEAQLEAAFSSVRLAAEPTLQERLDALPYALNELGALRISRVLPNGATLLTIGEKDVDPAGTQPLVIIAPSIGAAPTPNDKLAFAETALSQLSGYANFEMTSQQLSESGQASIIETHAEAIDVNTGEPRKIFQWMRFGANGGYLRLIATSPPDRWSETQEAFRAVIGGLSIK